MNTHASRLAIVAMLSTLLATSAARAELVLVGVDAKAENINGVTKVPANAGPDLVQIFDMKQFPPKLVGSVEAPVGVAGPPEAIAVAPDESFAIVASVSRLDPQKPGTTGP